MPTVALQQLATRAQFDIFGVNGDRHSETDDVVEAHIRAASGVVLAAMEPWVRRPLLEWGEDIVSYVCTIAAWQMRGMIGFDPDGYEFEALSKRFDTAMEYVGLLRTRDAPPVGVVDSTDDTLDADGDRVESNPNSPRIRGYPKRTYQTW